MHITELDQLIEQKYSEFKEAAEVDTVSETILVFDSEYLPLNESAEMNSQKHTPNKLALFFVGILHKPEDREFMLDDIQERFAKEAEKYGLRWAKWMLWRDNLVGLWSAVGARTIKGLKWLGFGYVIEKFLFK